MKNKRDYREDEDEVNEGTGNMEDQTKEPENDEKETNDGEHKLWDFN